MDLAYIWFFILAFAFLMYVLLDGFDLGTGILCLFSRDEDFRSKSMSSLAGVWHANQTWLVVFGASLFGAFPLAYGVVLSALYIPILILLVGLILRGIGLELYESSEHKKIFGLCFSLGSLVSAMAQGVGVGAFLTGFKVADGSFAGGVWDWLGFFSLLLALGLPVFYVLLGATRLMDKMDGADREFSRKAGLISGVLAAGAAGAVVVYGLATEAFWARHWFAWPGFLYTSVLLAGGSFFLGAALASLAVKLSYLPFGFSVLGVSFLFFGVTFGVYPYVVPPAATLTQAMGQPEALALMTVSFCIFFPLIVLYNVYMYLVFRGKAGATGYSG